MNVEQAHLEKQDDHRYQLKGELSFSTVPDLVYQIKDLFKDESDIVIDLSSVVRSDSAGVALLVEWVGMAHKDGKKLCFFNIPEQMLAIARVSSLDTILPLDKD